MKRILVGIIMLSMILFASCTKAEETSVLTHAEYINAANLTTVTIEAYIQGKQSWWESDGMGVASFYLQDQDGGYFVYNLPCEKDAYDNDLTIGKKVRITGQKMEWSGEIEINGAAPGAEATYTILNDKEYIATPKDVTSFLGLESLKDSQNMAVEFKNLYVLAQDDGVSAFYYQWDNSGKDGDDLYLSFFDGTTVLTACIETDLCDKNSEVYQMVKTLSVGDKVDLEGFLYWYNGAQPHLTKITKTGVNIFDKAEGVSTHAEYVATKDGTAVVIEAFIQGKQSWWESDGIGVASLYLQDQDGGYFAYNLPCSKEDYDSKLTLGRKIRILGNKNSWSGEIEIDGLAAGAEATYEILDDVYFAVPVDVRNLLSTTGLIDYQNMYVSIRELTVVGMDQDSVIYYKYNNSGSRGDDIYFKVSDGNNNYTFIVESSLCDENSACYRAVEALQDGDKINIEGFLYWYNGAQPHVTQVSKA